MAGDYFGMVLTMLLGYFEPTFTRLVGGMTGDYFEEVFTTLLCNLAGDYFDMVLTMLLGSMAGGYFEEVVTMFFAMLLGSTARDPAASTAKPVKTDVAVGARVAWHCTVVQRLLVTAIVAIGL